MGLDGISVGHPRSREGYVGYVGYLVDFYESMEDGIRWRWCRYTWIIEDYLFKLPQGMEGDGSGDITGGAT